MTMPLHDQEHPAAIPQEGPTLKDASNYLLDQRNALASLGAELLRRAEDSQPILEAAWDEWITRLGIHGQPIGIQRLREQIQQEGGGKPIDNAFTQELIALREEHRP